MSEPAKWWQDNSSFLDDALPHINESTHDDDPVGKCEALFKALNKTWNAYYLYRKRSGRLTEVEAKRTDAQAFNQLLQSGIGPVEKEAFVRSNSFHDLAMFSPHVMNHDTLLSDDYDPFDIPDRLRKKASEEHRQLSNAFSRYLADHTNQESQQALLKKAGQLLYVIRSNIAHSEKTVRGPDLEKNKRDRAVSEVAVAVVEEFFELLFDHPSMRLAVYGTLAPGQPNEAVLSNIPGKWDAGTIDGEVCNSNGLPAFRWQLGKNHVDVRLFTSPNLAAEFPRLSKFEGPTYRRILVPARTSSGRVVANVYAAAEESDCGDSKDSNG